MREISPVELKRKIEILNPHWKTGAIDQSTASLGRREYFNLLYPLIKNSSVHRAIILLGPRRVGKTILLHQTIQKLIDDGVSPKNIIYLSVDTPLLQGLDLDQLLELYLEIHDLQNPDDCYVIFDEIQYLANWENHLKTLVDQYKRTRFIGSGSAAAALKRKSQESGAGRFTDFILPPITFCEYLRLLKLEETALANIDILNKEFIRYMNFGGYPEAMFNKEIQQNPERFVRSDILEKALLRDLPSLYGIQDIQELTRLFNTLAYQTGNEVTLDGLSKTSGVAKNTIKKYIEYLESAFLIKTVSRVDNCGRTFKRENFFKVYLTNPSMYAALIEPITEDGEAVGSIVETAIFSQLMHDLSGFDSVVYARWSERKKQGEVDLIRLDERFRVAGALEVKWSDRYFDHAEELSCLIQFCKDCEMNKAVVTSKTKHGSKIIDDTEFIFVPAASVCYQFGKLILERKHAMQFFLQEATKIK